jgi:type I restriction enzyme S subunit
MSVEALLPPSWLECSLGDVIDYGRTDKAEPQEIPADAWVLELEDVEKDTSRVLHRATYAERRSKSTKNRFKPGDVLYGKLRPYLNKVVRAKEGGFCTTEIIPLTPTAELDGSYLFYWLKHPRFLEYVTSVSHGLNMPRLGTDAGKAAPFVLAPLPEQKRIAGKLDALLERVDACRERLDRVPGILKRFRQAVLAAATSGELTREWREGHSNSECATALLERTRFERRRNWAAVGGTKSTAKYRERERPDSDDLPQLPTGWCWASIDEVGDVMLGRQRAPQYLSGKHFHPYLRVANIKDDRIDFGDIQQMDFDEEHFIKYVLLPGDILVSEGQSPDLLGQSAIFRGEMKGLCFQKTLHRFRADPALTSAEYAQLVFRSHVATGTFRARGSVTTNIAHLTLEKFKACPFPLPPLDEQQRIVEVCSALLSLGFAVSARAEAVQGRIAQLTRATLTKAFRGELVPQDPTDESAYALLERIQSPRDKKVEPDRAKRARPAGTAT